MIGFSTERHITQAVSAAPVKLGTSFRPDRAERDKVLRCLQELVDGGFASWWINEAGCTELHFVDGKAFLLQDEGVVCLR
jgi:hypothetical protein